MKRPTLGSFKTGNNGDYNAAVRRACLVGTEGYRRALVVAAHIEAFSPPKLNVIPSETKEPASIKRIRAQALREKKFSYRAIGIILGMSKSGAIRLLNPGTESIRKAAWRARHRERIASTERRKYYAKKIRACALEESNERGVPIESILNEWRA